ncbi:MAG: hypothetical protein WCA07_08505 [Gloeobacterales cyanobacterium]
MNRLFTTGLATVALMVPVFFDAAAFARDGALAQSAQTKPQVQLALAAEKKIIQRDEKGKEQVTWQALDSSKTVVQSGDVLRYTVTGKNTSDKPAANLVITEPMPKGTVYILNSNSVDSEAKTTYSIDGAKSFTDKPMVKVTLPNGKVESKPAPAEAYTNVRWNFANNLAPKAAVKAMYEVKVR